MGANSKIEWTETGRSVASNGYVLIRVGKDHPLADVRGYAYEHRLVASVAIGRWVFPSEQVHHRNEIKTDNRPENLEVHDCPASHHFLHRKFGSDRRSPGESNPVLVCACGCGTSFNRFDEFGRPREYVSGHNPIPAPRCESILRHLEDGPKTAIQLGQIMGVDRRPVTVALSKLRKRGIVIRIRHGLYCRKAVA